MQVSNNKLVLSKGVGHGSKSAAWFSGINTDFITKVSLERQSPDQWADLMRDAGIASNAYGEVRLDFVDSRGAEQTGFVCDMYWGFTEAETVCRQLGFQSGLPTYNGAFFKDQGRCKHP